MSVDPKDIYFCYEHMQNLNVLSRRKKVAVKRETSGAGIHEPTMKDDTTNRPFDECTGSIIS
jgi:hypothetical protein